MRFVAGKAAPDVLQACSSSGNAARRPRSQLLVEAQVLDALAVAPDQLQRLDADVDVRLDEAFGDLQVRGSVFTPSGIIGWSLTSSSAPQGIELAKPAAKIVAVSMSIAMQRSLRR